MIAAILALWATTAPAYVDAGEVRVWRPEAAVWDSIYRCQRPARMTQRQLAWADGELFIACPGEPLARWRPGQLGARPVSNPVLARLRPTVLGSGTRAVFFADLRAVWRYRPAHGMVERIGAAPEWPLRWLAETPMGLVACGQFRWQWREGRWLRVKPRSFTSYSQAYPGS